MTTSNLSRRRFTSLELMDALQRVGTTDDARAAWLCLFADAKCTPGEPRPLPLKAEVAVFSMNLGHSSRQLAGRMFTDAEIDECHHLADRCLTDLITSRMVDILMIPKMMHVTLTVSREGEPDPPPRWTAQEGTDSFIAALCSALAATKRLIGQCPNCMKRFVGSKQGQQFCQRTCANRFSVRRWRQEQQRNPQRGAHDAEKANK